MWTVSPILSDVCALFKSREMKGRAERLWVSSPACDRERGRVTFNLLQFLQPVTLSWLRNTRTHTGTGSHTVNTTKEGGQSQNEVCDVHESLQVHHTSHLCLRFLPWEMLILPLCDWLDHNPQIGKSLTFKYVGQSWLGAQGDWF